MGECTVIGVMLEIRSSESVQCLGLGPFGAAHLYDAPVAIEHLEAATKARTSTRIGISSVSPRFSPTEIETPPAQDTFVLKFSEAIWSRHIR